MRLFAGKCLLIAVLLCGSMGCNAPNRQALTVEQRQLNDESFDYVWETVSDRPYDPNINRLDWDAVRDEFQLFRRQFRKGNVNRYLVVASQIQEFVELVPVSRRRPRCDRAFAERL